MSVLRNQEGIDTVTVMVDGEKAQKVSDTSSYNSDKNDPEELQMDHGVVAWLQVLGSWILFANTW